MKQETIDRIRKFVADREWETFQTPANLAKSISIEASELLECFQWSDTEYNIEHVKEELADVMVCCRNLLDELGLDEDEIINAKMDQIDAAMDEILKDADVIHHSLGDPTKEVKAHEQARFEQLSKEFGFIS